MTNKNTTWDDILNLYKADNVQSLCLTLQDEGGHCVSLLLWGASQVGCGYSINDVVEDAARLAMIWEATLRPLRDARNRLKYMPKDDQTFPESLRQQIIDCELSGERAMIQALSALVTKPITSQMNSAQTMLSTFRMLSKLTGADPNHPALTTLADKLAELLSMR